VRLGPFGDALPGVKQKFIRAQGLGEDQVNDLVRKGNPSVGIGTRRAE
jgi:hypothetical protein